MASSLCNSSSTFKVWIAIGATIIVVIWSFFRFEENPLIDRRFVEVIRIVGGAVGPESFAFDPHGDGPYTGVSDGRIIKWLQNETRWFDFALTSPNRSLPSGSSSSYKACLVQVTSSMWFAEFAFWAKLVEQGLPSADYLFYVVCGVCLLSRSLRTKLALPSAGYLFYVICELLREFYHVHTQKIATADFPYL
uniref:Strictosidine synthase n=1 Tax=Solanum tuberosum TaxID=4113 RepID=M1BMP3_SOLTU